MEDSRSGAVLPSCLDIVRTEEDLVFPREETMLIVARTLRACRSLALALALLLPLVLAGTPLPAAAGADLSPRYFPETGHTVSGRFREVWEGRGGLFIFGLPLTSQFAFPSTDGKVYQTQFFERAVFELHPENAAPYDVLLTQVGREAAVGRQSEVAFKPTSRNDDPELTYFPETGHNVGPTFLAYWKKFGGLASFGFPLSEMVSETNEADGRSYLVIYFERARMEYHPENAGTDFAVLLGQLGRERMERAGVPARVRAAESPVSANSPATPPIIPPGVIVTNRSSAPGYPFLQGPRVGLGIQAQFSGQPRGRLIGMVRDIGFSWTKQQVVWRDIEMSKGKYVWSELDAVVNDLSAAHLQIMLSVVKAPAWATVDGRDGIPRDPRDFADFMGAITARYQDKVAAYQLWNEPNLAGEVGGKVDAGAYVELVKAGYMMVKAVDPYCVVVLGGLASTGINDPTVAIEDTVYLEQLYQYQGGAIRDYFDVLGSHPYGLANPPDTLWSEGKPGPQDKFYDHDSFYFRRFEAHRAIMEKYGDGHKQIWLTEWGYGSDFSPSGHIAFNRITEEMRAKYVTDAILMLRARYDYIGATFLWNLNFSVISPSHTDPAIYAIIGPDYTPRPVYYALKALPK